MPAQARSAVPLRCGDAGDSPARALCTGRLRVDVRGDYPPFGQAVHGEPEGLEPALARVLAGHLNLVGNALAGCTAGALGGRAVQWRACRP